MLQGFNRKFKPIDLISDEEMEGIHKGALYVLETTGMRIEHDKALQLSADNGCKVDFDQRMVRFPTNQYILI